MIIWFFGIFIANREGSNGMVEYWNVDAKKNFPINHYPNIPKRLVSLFHYSRLQLFQL